jgi:hypothetical protein
MLFYVRGFFNLLRERSDTEEVTARRNTGNRTTENHVI